MKVALIHDHLTQYGGAERVLEVLQSMWPEAPTFTLIYDKDKMNGVFEHQDIKTSFLQYLPFSKRGMRWLLPLMPTATESYDLSEFDMVISSSSAFAKGVITRPETIHICYCHTPTRYLWTDTHDYIKGLNAPKIVKQALPILLSVLRIWDRIAADRVDFFIANSKTVDHRIDKFYKQKSTVIHPPVDVHEFSISNEEKKYFLIGGRLVDYKRYDLVIDAFNNIGLPLKVFGSGPMEKALRKRASSNIEFLGRVSDKKRSELFSNAIAFIHPQEEDFGITPVESMSAGRPVIAYRKGGATETVVDGVTGEFFDNQDWEDLANTLLHFKEEKYNPEVIKKHAETFSTQRFRKEMDNFVESTYEKHRREHLGLL